MAKAKPLSFPVYIPGPGTTSRRNVLACYPRTRVALQLRIHHDLKASITYSARLEALTPDHLVGFIHCQLDRAGLPHATFTGQALNLIARSSEGTLRAVKNLCIGSLIEAARDRVKTVDLKQVNAILLQLHWRHNPAGEAAEPVFIPPYNLPRDTETVRARRCHTPTQNGRARRSRPRPNSL